MPLETFVWDDLFVTGLDMVDAQHHQLIDLVNELSIALIRSDGAELPDVFERLVDYTHYHFGAEERLMDASGVDPRHARSHKAAHADFIAQIAEMSRTATSTPALLDYLVSWLSFHILGADHVLARQVARIRGGEEPARAYELETEPRDRKTTALVRALHKLYEVVSAQNRELALTNQRLEERVLARTRELEEANRLLELRSRTDGLLAIANRAYFDERLALEWKRSRRERWELAILMLDVDLFKRYNDTYGHLQGDACLRAVARAASASVRRPADLLARYGGEELVAMLPQTNLAGACHVAHRILAAVSGLQIPHAGSHVAAHVTVSIGVAAARPSAESPPSDLLGAADAALYEAKRGRNRVRPELTDARAHANARP